eukprot:2955272-Rhodomonas_salina.3
MLLSTEQIATCSNFEPFRDSVGRCVVQPVYVLLLLGCLQPSLALHWFQSLVKQPERDKRLMMMRSAASDEWLRT